MVMCILFKAMRARRALIFDYLLYDLMLVVLCLYLWAGTCLALVAIIC